MIEIVDPSVEAVFHRLAEILQRLPSDAGERVLIERIALFCRETSSRGRKALNFAAQKLTKARGIKQGAADLMHAVRTAGLLAERFSVVDEDLMLTALLHDILDQSDADVEELEQEFGETVADYLVLLTPPRFFPKAERERLYEEGLLLAPEVLLLIKVAELYDEITYRKSPRCARSARAHACVLHHVAARRHLQSAIADELERVLDLLRRLPPKTARSSATEAGTAGLSFQSAA